jgi:hypothetical protein
MTLSRVYVNPSTGVGPDAADLVPFATIMLSPKSISATSGDSTSFRSVAEQVLASQGPHVGGNAAGIGSLSRGSLAQAQLSVGEFDASKAHHMSGGAGQAGHGALGKTTELFEKARKIITTNVSDEHTSRNQATDCVVGADRCVQSFVGMSQCSGKGSWDVCCQYVQAWSNDDCWNEDSGQLLLNNMPTVLTPTLLQVLSMVCESE